MSRLDPYLRQLGITSGQACTLSLGLVLGGVLLATSVPPVWDRANQPRRVAAVAPPTLEVVSSGWSSTRSGAAATAGIPDGALPVGVQSGEPVETSYVRLQGSATRLLLSVARSGGATYGPDEPDLRACRIRSADWVAARPGPAVPFDPGACVAARQDSAGRWSFDLRALGPPDDPRGIALTAAPGTTKTYRVSLTPTRSTA